MCPLPGNLSFKFGGPASFDHSFINATKRQSWASLDPTTSSTHARMLAGWKVIWFSLQLRHYKRGNEKSERDKPHTHKQRK